MEVIAIEAINKLENQDIEKASQINPDWVDAPYEVAFIWADGSRTLTGKRYEDVLGQKEIHKYI